MMSQPVFLFDLDGVIVDTAVYHYQAWKRLAQELGFDIDEEFNEQLKGISRVDSLHRILEHGQVVLTEADFDRWATQKNTWYLELIEEMTPQHLLPGVADFFSNCRTNGIRCGLGSASKNAPKILEKVGLLVAFDALVDGNSVSKSKPDPEVFLKGAELLGVEPARCIVFEDALAGIEAAEAAGMKSVGIGDPTVLTQATMVIPGFLNVTVNDILTKINNQ